MRSDRAAMLAVLAISSPSCAITDVDRPIGLIADDLTADNRVDLEEAARCWNLQLGTQFVVGAEAAAVDQQVELFYSDATCLHATADVQAGWPARIAVCPERYWEAVPYPFTEASAMFRVLSHELGHVANIVGHPAELAGAVMNAGTAEFEAMFTDVDLEMFADANPDYTPVSPCDQVVRSMRPGTDGRVSHCACDSGPFDLDRPIAIVIAPGAANPDLIAAAAGCWNLRYGLSLAVRPPEPGDQIAYLERTGGCTTRVVPAGVLLRAQDGDEAVVCAGSGQATQMQDVANVLGVYHNAGNVGPAFFAGDHEQFAQVYPGRAIACQDVAIDWWTGVCTCADRP